MNNATDETFEDLVSNGRVLVDFWAEWCGPCKVMLPILEEINNDDNGVTVIKVNVDEYPALAAEFEVASIPTMVLMNDGDEIKRIIGAQPKRLILNQIL
jgi:thioredoxin 1